MVAAATLAGATSFRSVADYIGDRRHPRTRRFVAPSEPTIRRTVTSVDAAEADVLVGRWLAEQVRAGRLAARQVPTCTALALDGKTLNGSWAEVNTGSGKVRLFSALGHREGVVVGQRTIPADTNELTGGRPAAGRGRRAPHRRRQRRPDRDRHHRGRAARASRQHRSAARPGRGVRAEACRATSRRWNASWPRSKVTWCGATPHSAGKHAAT